MDDLEQSMHLPLSKRGNDDTDPRIAEETALTRRKPRLIATKNELGTVLEGNLRARGLTPGSVISSRASSMREGPLSRPLIATSLDKKMDFLLRSFSTTHLARIYWNQAQAADYGNHVIRLALRKPVLLNALMTKSLTDFQTAGGALPAGSVPRDRDKEEKSLMIDFNFFLLQTVTGLRTALDSVSAEQPESSIVVTILLLLKTELLVGTMTSVRMHLHGIRNLLGTGTLLDNFSPCARSPPFLTVNLACLVTQEPPFLVPASYPSTAMSEEVTKALNNCPNALLSGLARGFDVPAMRKLLGPQVLFYIQWQRIFLMMREMTMSGHLEKVTVEDYGISSSMVHRADYHLMTLPYLTQLNPLRNLVRLVLLVSDISTFIGLRPRTMFVCCLALQLKEALLAMDLASVANLEEDVVRLMIWVCFYGVELSLGRGEQLWFLSYLRQSQEVLNLHDRAEILELLVSFMYTERQFIKISAIVWEAVAETNEDVVSSI
ncbi:hypothetical protein H2200_000212 [Cladophialophora chaetospira]|uniref:Uncharacterized protein n=1 Tax=Cladophialophora chaetospira TaxID=386627 RepID=A0AA39CQQ6_9EURO|nr:hypothetical protein H2200_000212 [Cladophialophora chaetospira]